MISRRKFLSAALSLAGGWAVFGPSPSLGSPFPQFYFTQIKYRGGEWDPNPLFAEAMVEELELRTSIDASKERRVLELSDPDLFFCPFLYMAGRYEFDPLTQQERATLRRFLTYGGFLFAEDTVGAKGFGFDRAFRKEMQEIFPDHDMKRLPPDHAVYQSFYLIGNLGGRQVVNPYLEGVTINRWTAVIYSQDEHDTIQGAMDALEKNQLDDAQSALAKLLETKKEMLGTAPDTRDIKALTNKD